MPSVSSFDSTRHLAWGNVSIDNRESPKIILKRSKTDQSGRGVEVFIGCTDGPLCPLATTLSYILERGTSPGPFFRNSDSHPLLQSNFVTEVRKVLIQIIGLPYQYFAGHSFRGNFRSKCRARRLTYSHSWQMEQRYIKSPKEHLAHFSSFIANRYNTQHKRGIIISIEYIYICNHFNSC